MGKIELLRGGFVGKVGSVYGERQHRNIYAKSVPFSHTPHNEAQKNAWSAFGCLQRFVSPIARDFYKALPYNFKNKNRINVIASKFKAMVSRGVFSPEKIVDVFPQSSDLEIVSVAFDRENHTLSGTITNVVQSAQPVDDKIYCAVVKGNGEVLFSRVGNGSGITFLANTAFGGEDVLYLVAFKTFRRGSRIIFGGSAVLQFNGDTSQDYILDGILYLDKTARIGQVFMQDSILHIISPTASIANSRLTVVS